MALRHEPFEECRCCDKARGDIELYQREILAASATVEAGGKTWVVVPAVKAEIDRLRNALQAIVKGDAVVFDDDEGCEVEVAMGMDEAQALARHVLQTP